MKNFSIIILFSTFTIIYGCSNKSTIDAASGVNKKATAETYNWFFDQGTSAQYSFDSTKLELEGGLIKLPQILQIDSYSNTGTFSTGSGTGVVLGALADGSFGLKLGNGGGCKGTATNCSQLDSSWTPR